MVLIKIIVILKKRGGVHIKNYHQIICRNDDSDDMEYTEDAIDNMILEFSGD